MANTVRRFGAGGLLLCVLSLVAVGGCATGYHRANIAGGYESSCLQDDIHQVSFYGNGYTHRDRATDFALLRAAEVASEEGCPYFIVVEKGTHSEISTHTAPLVAQTSGSVDSFGEVSATTVVSGGETYTSTKPSSKMLIRVLKSRPEGSGPLVYDAAQIQRNLRKKYGIEAPE